MLIPETPSPRAMLRVLKFGISSGMGLSIDLIVYLTLDSVGIDASLANLVSSFLAITALYFLVSRYAFQKDPNPFKFLYFVVWYSAMILAMSAIVHVMHSAWGFTALFAKLVTIPVSFVLNYFFSKRLFANKNESLAMLNRTLN